jgi:hypothetical protein
MTTPTTESRATVSPTGCCPPFDPQTWDGREVVWRDKLFVKEHAHAVLHVPIDMGRVITRAKEKIDAAGASPEQPLMLSDDHLFGTDLYIEVTHAVPGLQNVTLSGTYMTKVFDGPFKDAPKWVETMQWVVSMAGRSLRRMYFGYTTCPACAAAYGHNYVVLFAEVEPVA